MKRGKRRAIGVATLIAAIVTGFAIWGASGNQVQPSAPPAPLPTSLPTGDELRYLNPLDFSADITNPYLPLTAGTRWTYREVEDGETKTITVVATTTTRVLANGIEARVIRDTVRGPDGQIEEDTFDWYAQHRDGAVWYLGEDTAEMEDGKITSRHGSFEAGVNGAQGGIAMPAQPEVGQTYRQEWAAGQAEDYASIISADELVPGPLGTHKHTLMTKDVNPLEQGAPPEYKFYAKGVGLVAMLSPSGAHEELVKIDTVPDGYGTGPLGGGK